MQTADDCTKTTTQRARRTNMNKQRNTQNTQNLTGRMRTHPQRIQEKDRSVHKIRAGHAPDTKEDAHSWQATVGK